MPRLPHLSMFRAAITLALAGAAGLPANAADAPTHTRTELRAEIGQADALVAACAGLAGACKSSAVPGDETVAAEGAAPRFTLRWDWLRDALDDAKNASASDRAKAMQASHARLNELLGETGGAAQAPDPAFAQARHTADDILARAEFAKVAPPSWWDRLLAKFRNLLASFFEGVGNLTGRTPWLGTVLEWLLFLGAAVGLLLFVRRNLQRQRLQASLAGGEAAALTAWDREATDWAAMAARSAEAGDWREAVHSLYWAAIVKLESRRAWRHNPARTPREYVRLLKPGSVPRESLRGLTGLLERVWYGLRPAGAEDYQQARVWFERLSESGSAAPASRERA